MAIKKRNLPSASCPTLKIVALGHGLQPNSRVGPMCLLQCSPAHAPVSSRASEHAAVPEGYGVLLFV